ncbi:hypothetical protein K2173_012041 [Erythroxylum novogranatense]|uniref:Reticulon-like protein n=1 Tax=Erythroxylum novogranatense TaxID=1862640 RepID=A0AAV8TH49_9ROSI|nr:hypothetical protein K2173_012041 [Erythroxylum novogranatense]
MTRTAHEILGGGSVADVILWRQKNVTLGMLLATLSSWVVFERSGYTLLSLISSVLLLLLTILFIWAKSAAILNRPPPPLPVLHLSEEMVKEVNGLIRNRVNDLLSVFEDIALGKDTNLYFKVLCISSLLSKSYGLILHFISACALFSFSHPCIYEIYEDCVDKHINIAFRKLRHLYAKFDVECVGRVRNWILEKQKLS